VTEAFIQSAEDANYTCSVVMLANIINKHVIKE